MASYLDYLNEPDRYPCPTPLVLYKHMGDNRTLVDGGLLTQPAGLWFAAQYAGWIQSLNERVSTEGFKVSSLSPSEQKFYFEVMLEHARKPK